MRLMRPVYRWIPALAMMGAIFFFSSIPASRLPFFGEWDLVVKKGGHVTGYALLGVSYFYALPPRLSTSYRALPALLLAAPAGHPRQGLKEGLAQVRQAYVAHVQVGIRARRRRAPQVGAPSRLGAG